MKGVNGTFQRRGFNICYDRRIKIPIYRSYVNPNNIYRSLAIVILFSIFATQVDNLVMKILSVVIVLVALLATCTGMSVS